MRFKDVTGREAVKRQLRRLVDEGQLPHALLLWGPEGSGKLALARALAQYMHCENRRDGDSCGKCPACRQHEKLNFPDLAFSYPTAPAKKGQTTVSDDLMEQWGTFLREWPLAPYRRWLEVMGADNSQPVIRVTESADIIMRLSRGSYSSGTKVLIVWLPEKLHPAAANKLLKVIEEPEPGVMFIMVSDRPSDILPTVLSRLRRVRVPVPTIAETAAWLENEGVEPTKAMEAASVAGGNPSAALELLESQGESDEFRSLFQEVMRKAWARDVAGLRAWSEEVAGMKREKSRRFLENMARQVRDNYLLNFGVEGLVAQQSADSAFSQRFAPFIHAGNVEDISSDIDAAMRDIAGNANARIVLFDTALRLTRHIHRPGSNG